MISRKIAVLGGGNGAHCMAADMKLKGHTVKMFEFPEYKHNMQKVFDTQTVIAKGKTPGAVDGVAKLDLVTDDIAEAVKDAEIILLVTPAFAHEHYAEALKGHVKKEQIIVTFPGAFAALVIRRFSEMRNVRYWQTQTTFLMTLVFWNRGLLHASAEQT